MEKVQCVHYSLPAETREEKAVNRLDEIIDKKLQEKKMEKEKQKKMLKEILKLRNKYFQNNAVTITKIVIRDFLIIQKEAVVLDGIPIGEDEEGNTEIDVERILQKLEEIDEKDVVVI